MNHKMVFFRWNRMILFDILRKLIFDVCLAESKHQWRDNIYRNRKKKMKMNFHKFDIFSSNSWDFLHIFSFYHSPLFIRWKFTILPTGFSLESIFSALIKFVNIITWVWFYSEEFMWCLRWFISRQAAFLAILFQSKSELVPIRQQEKLLHIDSIHIKIVYCGAN